MKGSVEILPSCKPTLEVVRSDVEIENENSLALLIANVIVAISFIQTNEKGNTLPQVQQHWPKQRQH